MAKTPEMASGASEKLVEVKLLRNYVPADSPKIEGTDAFVKRFAGEVLELPRTEAKRAIELGIAAVTADLV